MDPVHILMDPVHGPGPRRGSMDQGPMFCTFPIYTANEEAVLKSILLVSLDNSWTLLFILDNPGLKIGNCCWLVLLSVFPVRLFIKNFSGQEVVKLLRR